MQSSIQPSTTNTNPHWSSIREAGTLAGMKFLYVLHKYLGRRVFSLVMFPVAIYFAFFKPVARRASLQFLQMHWSANPGFWSTQPGYWQVIVHIRHFAEAILDKVLAWSAEISDEVFVIEDHSVIEKLMADPRGQLIIGTHFGNLEYCRGFMQRYRDKVINILVYDKHSANFVEIMQRVNPDSRINIFQVDEFDVATILLLKGKISNGEWVFIAGDRIPLTGLQRTVTVDFMGKKAPLPIGPYLLAKALECPVKIMFGYRHPNLDPSKVYFEVVPFTDQLTFSRTNREAQLQAYAQEFANCLQKHCNQAPYQWFNFYDFWETSQSVAAEGAKQSTKQDVNQSTYQQGTKRSIKGDNC
jgi:predicted LPLAT superfamily acyltransferase